MKLLTPRVRSLVLPKIKILSCINQFKIPSLRWSKTFTSKFRIHLRFRQTTTLVVKKLPELLVKVKVKWHLKIPKRLLVKIRLRYKML